MRVEWFIGNRSVTCLNIPQVTDLLIATQVLGAFHHDVTKVTIWPNEDLRLGDLEVRWCDGEHRMVIAYADKHRFDHSDVTMFNIARQIENLSW